MTGSVGLDARSTSWSGDTEWGTGKRRRAPCPRLILSHRPGWVEGRKVRATSRTLLLDGDTSSRGDEPNGSALKHRFHREHFVQAGARNQHPKSYWDLSLPVLSLAHGSKPDVPSRSSLPRTRATAELCSRQEAIKPDLDRKRASPSLELDT